MIALEWIDVDLLHSTFHSTTHATSSRRIADEVLLKTWIRQAAFFLHGQIRKALHQPGRESSAS
jgi:hypothetical protein